MRRGDLSGRDFAHYEVLGVVGRGGMGVVYRARDRRLGRVVALKVLSARYAEDELFRDRFIRESRLLASIDHPNIVPIFEADESDDELYIAMRFVDGPELHALIEDGSASDLDRAVGLIAQVADALDAAHAAGLVHRDVKPGNVLVVPATRAGSPGHAYLMDFGLTKYAGSDTGLTQVGQFVGTPGYVSPEQIEGKSVDHRADIYSLGCILYNCLTGAVPYPRDSTVASLWAHLKDAPPQPSEHRPGLSTAFDAVIARALAKAPQDRYQTAGALAAAARDALKATTSRPAPTVVAPVVAAVASTVPEASVPEAPVPEASVREASVPEVPAEAASPHATVIESAAALAVPAGATVIDSVIAEPLDPVTPMASDADAASDGAVTDGAVTDGAITDVAEARDLPIGAAVAAAAVVAAPTVIESVAGGAAGLASAIGRAGDEEHGSTAEARDGEGTNDSPAELEAAPEPEPVAPAESAPDEPAPEAPAPVVTGTLIDSTVLAAIATPSDGVDGHDDSPEDVDVTADTPAAGEPATVEADEPPDQTSGTSPIPEPDDRPDAVPVLAAAGLAAAAEDAAASALPDGSQAEATIIEPVAGPFGEPGPASMPRVDPDGATQVIPVADVSPVALHAAPGGEKQRRRPRRVAAIGLGGGVLAAALILVVATNGLLGAASASASPSPSLAASAVPSASTAAGGIAFDVDIDGESLQELADRLQVTVDQLRTLNPDLDTTTILQLGDIVLVPLTAALPSASPSPTPSASLPSQPPPSEAPSSAPPSAPPTAAPPTAAPPTKAPRDTTAPSANARIRGGSTSTRNPAITVETVGASERLAGIRLGASKSALGSWRPYGEAVGYTLRGGDGRKTVFVQWRDPSGNPSAIDSVAITLDTHGPRGTARLDGTSKFTKDRSVVVTITGLSEKAVQMKVGFTQHQASTTTPVNFSSRFSKTVSSSIGTKSIFVYLRDRLGNWNGPFKDTIIYDHPPVAFSDTWTLDSGYCQWFIPVLNGATDPDGDTISLVGVSNPPNGTASIVSGTAYGHSSAKGVLYKVDPNRFGHDSFTFRIQDSHGMTDTGTANFTVPTYTPGFCD